MELRLPTIFEQTILGVFGEAGRAWLKTLPALVDSSSSKWNLRDIHTGPNLSYNFVAFARRADQEVVLKIGVLNRELQSEVAALRIFDGQGAARLLEADATNGCFLLERLRPGEMLSTLSDDERATHIAAEVMRKLWRPAPSGEALIQLSDWFQGFGKLRARFEGGTGPLEKGLVERAERAVDQFFAEAYSPTLIHGDLHHFNILSSDDTWLAIDPKGVVGPAGYEVGPFLINPWDSLLKQSNPRQITERRLAILSEHLNLERARLLEWGLAHAVLSAWWNIEGHEDWEHSMSCARLFANLTLN